jgi:hypothetical protein
VPSIYPKVGIAYPTERIGSLKVKFKKGFVARRINFNKANADDGKGLNNSFTGATLILQSLK